MLPIDLHTHTAASGHGTTDTIADLAKSAYRKGMKMIGISDHGPATPGSCRESYFRVLKSAPRVRSGITVLYGAEANILNEQGLLDLSENIRSGLDFCIAAIHPQSFRSACYHRLSFTEHKQITEDRAAAAVSNTWAYIRAMEQTNVRIIAHPDDQHYPILCEPFIEAAAANKILLEVNEASLAPGGYRGDTTECMLTLLQLARKAGLTILLSSDSHGAAHIGEAPLAKALAKEAGFRKEQIANFMSPSQLQAFLQNR